MGGSALGKYSLFVAIIFWGIIIGGITYAHIVYFPPYLADLPNSAVIVTGKHALNEGRFWMMIHPVLILSLITTLVLNWRTRSRRSLILVSMGIYFVVLVCTQLYFLPELGAFRESASSTVTPAEWLARGNRWQYLSWIRGAFMYAGILPLLSALTKVGEASRD